MQGLIDQLRTEGLTLAGIGFGELDCATHESHRGHGVPCASHHEHGLDMSGAIACIAHQLGNRSVEHELCRRHFARAEFVLEPLDANTVECAIRLMGFDIEHRQSTAAGTVALRTRKRERHLRGDRRGKPFLAIQTPAIAFEHGTRERATHIGTACGLGHPLTARPESSGIPTREMRQRSRYQLRVARDLQCPGCAVGHRERTGVNVG